MIRVLPKPGHPTGGALCAKGRSAPEQIASPLRLTRPLRRTTPRDASDPKWEEIGWDEALDEIGSRLHTARESHGAESVAFALTTPSGTPMVDSAEWVERFVRLYGSPNVLYAVEVCGWHKDYAHALTFGRGIGMPDIERADVVLLWGHNPARTWLAQASRIATARQRGAQVVVIDPKQEGSAQQADLWIRVKPGADAAIALGAIRHLIETGRYAPDFVRRWTNASLLLDTVSGEWLSAQDFWPGLPADAMVTCDPQGRLRAWQRGSEIPEDTPLDVGGSACDVHGKRRHYASAFRLLAEHVAPYTVEKVVALAWTDAESIHRFNTILENAPRLAYHSWTGVGQHVNATQTERAIATLYALTGACDREGGNIWTVAPPWRQLNDYADLLPQAQRDKALGLEALPLGPPRLGWITARDLRRAVLEDAPYAVRTLMSFGTNLLATHAESTENLRMLQALDFHVHVDMFMNPTALNADIVLPASMPWEREALKLGFEITQAAVEMVQLRPRMIAPPGEARADYEIVMALALRLGMADAFFGGSVEAGWNHQLAPLGITVEQLRGQPEGLSFPQHAPRRKFARTGADGSPVGFDTATRRVELYSTALHGIGQPPLPSFVDAAPVTPESAFPIVLTTAKSGWFVHSSHRHVASLRRKSPHPQVQVSTALAHRIDVHEGEWVRVVTPAGSVRLTARIDPQLHDEVAVAEFGWWQGCDALGLSDESLQSSNINSILSDAQRDPVSGSVPLRAVACRIEPDAASRQHLWRGMRRFRLIEKRTVTAGVEAFEFETEDGMPLPDFLPGQHVVLSVPDFDTRRAYSLTSPCEAPSTLSIAVRLARTPNHPDGTMSSRLHAMQCGETVMLSPPGGTFTLPLRTQRPLVLMAGGIGITPFLGYLEALAALPNRPGKPPAVLLMHSCQNSGAHPFRDRLRQLAEQIGNVRIVSIYSQPLPHDRMGADYEGRPGDTADWLDENLVMQRPLAYLCGSSGFLQHARAALVAQGVPDFDVLEETFLTEMRIPDTMAPCAVRIEGERTFDWKTSDGTLLDAALQSGVELPSGCRVGQCESCAMTVVDGHVAHLAKYDGPADRCLTCIAVPLTPLVLRR